MASLRTTRPELKRLTVAGVLRSSLDCPAGQSPDKGFLKKCVNDQNRNRGGYSSSAPT